MTCSKNLSKYLKNSYQIKTDGEMSQHDFQFFAHLMILFSKKKKNSHFIYIFTFLQNFK